MKPFNKIKVGERFEIPVQGRPVQCTKTSDTSFVMEGVPVGLLDGACPPGSGMCERHQAIFYPNGRNPKNLYNVDPSQWVEPRTAEDYRRLATYARKIGDSKAAEEMERQAQLVEPLDVETMRIITNFKRRQQKETPKAPMKPEEEQGEQRTETASFDKIEEVSPFKSVEDAMIVHRLKKRLR